MICQFFQVKKPTLTILLPPDYFNYILKYFASAQIFINIMYNKFPDS